MTGRSRSMDGEGGGGVVSQQPPLECAFCCAPRWNDESVVWWPLYGPNRLPYCSATCAPFVQATTRIKRNGGLEVWAALHGKDEEWFA